MNKDEPTITRESFEKLPIKNKLDILFDYNVASHKQLKELQKTKIKNSAYSTISGFIGGAIAVLSLRIGEFFK